MSASISTDGDRVTVTVGPSSVTFECNIDEIDATIWRCVRALWGKLNDTEKQELASLLACSGMLPK